jgi:glucose/arabinose dehydrogenase
VARAFEQRRWLRWSLLLMALAGLALAALLSNSVPRARADVVGELRFAGNVSSCLEVYGGPGATHDGAEAAIWSCWGGSNQKVRVEDAGGGYYRIVFAHSNKCLEVPGWNPEWGVLLGQWTCHGGDNQKWSGTFGRGYFEVHWNKFLMEAYGSNMCISVHGGSPADGTPVLSWPCDPNSVHQWSFMPDNLPVPAGELRFAGNINSCLEIRGGPEATHDGATTAIWSCLGGSNQKIRVEDAGGGYYYIVFAHSNKCLEVPGWSLEWGVHLGQWTCHGGDNQKWTGTFGHGYFEVHWNKFLMEAYGSNMCISVHGGFTADGTPVLSWPCDPNSVHRWYLMPDNLQVSAGSELRFAGNVNSCLEIYGGPAATHDGAEAAIWSCWGGSSQKVRVEDAGGGYYRIVFAHSNKCLEVPGWNPEWGVHLGQGSCHGGDNQKWSGTFNNGAFAVHRNKFLLEAYGSSMCISVHGGSPADGTPVLSWPCDPNSIHQWYFLGNVVQPTPPGPPSGFEEVTVLSGLTYPTVVRFSPDGRIFVAEKSGLIKVFDSFDDTTATIFADLRANVYDFWDRGLLGMALHRNFPAEPYVYVLYTYDHRLGSPSPPPLWQDDCPTPPGPTTDGCIASGRLSRLQASGNVMTGSEHVLVEDWCQHFVGHTIGTVEFGPDGALYAGAGDSANFFYTDYGQAGSPPNPCGDPPGGAGASLSPPTAEGGALRSQDVRTTGDPTGLDGSIIRVDPATGAGLPTNPFASSPDLNARRIIAYGLRNPFRFTFRPGTSEIWAGDVGWNDWEEINRITNPGDPVAENFGWPCFEGGLRQAGYDAAGLSMCSSLAPSNVTNPFFAYHHANNVVTGETCPVGTSSISGLAFESSASTRSFPAEYHDALFFADYARGCIWAMKKNGNPIPSPGAIETFAANVAHPAHLQFGPDGNLYYVDFDGGTIRRIWPGSTPPAGTYLSDLAWISMTNGWGPVEKDRTNGDLAQGDGSTLTLSGKTYAKGLGAHAVSDVRYALGPGCSRFKASVGVDDLVGDLGSVVFQVYADNSKVFDSGVMTGASGIQNIDVPIAGASELRLVVTDAGDGISYDLADWALARIDCPGTNQPPVPVIDAPASALTWKVGDQISFSGHATDPEGGALPVSALSWTLIIHHCPSTCHTHVIQSQSWNGVTGGSFNAPDHEYPSHLELELTATDSDGASSTTSVMLHPQTVELTFTSNPTGLQLGFGSGSSPAPFTRTVIIGSVNGVIAPSPQTSGDTSYSFVSWSDGGGQTHNLTAPATNTTYTATYQVSPTATPTPPPPTATPTPPPPLPTDTPTPLPPPATPTAVPGP